MRDLGYGDLICWLIDMAAEGTPVELETPEWALRREVAVCAVEEARRADRRCPR